MLAMTTLSMLLIPVFDLLGRWWARRQQVGVPPAPVTLISPAERSDEPRAIIIGYGRVGRLVSDMLEGHAVPHLCVDLDPANVAHARRDGHAVYYGDAKNKEFLRQCGIETADAVLITHDNPADVVEILAVIRALRPDIQVIARARDTDHARVLYDLGASDAVPETIEASLQLAEASLVGLGVPTGLVIASIHEKRDEFRNNLQGVGGYMGQAGRKPEPQPSPVKSEPLTAPQN